MSTVEKSSCAYSTSTVEKSTCKKDGTNTVKQSSCVDNMSTVEECRNVCGISTSGECSNVCGISTSEECSSVNGANSVQESDSFSNTGFAKTNDNVKCKETFNCDKHSTYTALSDCHYESIAAKYEQLSSYEDVKVSNEFHRTQEVETKKCSVVETSAQSRRRAVDRSLRADDQPTTSRVVPQCERPQLNYCSNDNSDYNSESTVSLARPNEIKVSNKTDYFVHREQINLTADGYEEIPDIDNRPMPESYIAASSSSTQTQVNSKTSKALSYLNSFNSVGKKLEWCVDIA
jgi:hypothetical protein